MDLLINKNTAVVFDLDDTLYSELDYLRSAYKEIAERIDKENSRLIFGYMFSMYRNKLDVFEMLSNKYNADKIELIRTYRNHFPKLKLKDGVNELLTSIKKKKGKIAIITDGRSQTQHNKIKALNISKFIDYIITSEDIGEEKPSHAAYIRVEKRFNLDTYYYIGDNLKKDFLAPKKRGWKTIGLLDNGKNIHYNMHINLELEKIPKNFVYSLNEIKII